jgi:hypothetical protein
MHIMCKEENTLKKIRDFASNHLIEILIIMLILNLLNVKFNSEKDECARQSLEHMSGISCLQVKAVDAHISHMGYSMNKIEDHLCALENLSNENYDECLNEVKNRENYYDDKGEDLIKEYESYLLERNIRFDAYNSSLRSYMDWDCYGQWATFLLIIISIILIIIEKYPK